jgi:hypothetical protein
MNTKTSEDFYLDFKKNVIASEAWQSHNKHFIVQFPFSPVLSNMHSPSESVSTQKILYMQKAEKDAELSIPNAQKNQSIYSWTVHTITREEIRYA